MLKKAPLLSAVLPVLLVFAMASVSFADAPDLLKQAEAYTKAGDYAQAEQIYLQILTDFPGTDYAFQAQENLTCLYVTWGKEPEAEAALQDLLANFAQHEAIATAVTHVADVYRHLPKHNNACEIYQYVIDNWPQDEHAMWSQMGLVISNTCLRNEQAADTAFEKLCSDYSGQQLLARAICIVADNYRKLNRHEKAREVYQRALANQPDPEFTLWSRMGLAISSIRLGDYDAAVEAVNRLRTDFSQDQRISIAGCLIADEYRTSRKYENACELYEYVVDNWPGAEHALWSQMGLAISKLWAADAQAADAAADKLFSDFSKDKRSAVAACLLADEYRKMGNQDKACQFYQYVVRNWPDAEHALWSQMGLAISSIILLDDNAAQTAIEKLVTEFSGHKNILNAIQQIVHQYRVLQEYEKAEQVSQYVSSVLANRPESEHVMWSQVAKLVSNIDLGNDGDTQIAVDSLIADYIGDPDLPEAVFAIGTQYYNQAFRLESEGLPSEAKDSFRKAIAVWEQISQQLPASSYTLRAYNLSARCYELVGEYEKAIEYYYTILGDWPNSQKGVNAHFMIAHCLNELATSRRIPRADAAVLIKDACQRQLTDYPESAMAELALSLSEYWDSVSGKGERK